MINLPFDSSATNDHADIQPFPLDRLYIETKIRLRHEIAECSPEAVASLEPKFGKLVMSITHGVSTRTGAPPVPKRAITLYPDRAVRVTALKADEWLITEIDFNVGRLLLGHNGRILDTDSVHKAFSILLQVLRPLLADPDDLIHVLPGLDPASRAFWHSLEIPFQQFDPAGNLIRALENSKHSSINTPPKFRRRFQNTTFENSAGSLKLNCYRKDLELRDHKHLRRHLAVNCPVTRFEVTLRGDMLATHLKGGLWNDNRTRLTAFGPTDIHNAFKSVVRDLTGALCGEASERGDNFTYARIIPMMQAHGLCAGVTFDQFFEIYAARFLGDNTIESIRNAKSTIRKAWQNEVGSTLPNDVRSMFTDAAWRDQANVTAEAIEEITLAHSDLWCPDEHVVSAYSDRRHDTASVAS